MINGYVGGVIYDVMAQHGVLGNRANVLRDIYVPRWKAGGLTAAVVQVSDWSSINAYFAEFSRAEGEITYCTTRADYDNRPEGSFGIFFSLEGHGPFAGDLEALYTLSELGVGTFTFSHNRQNLLCTGSNEPMEGGFSYLGKEMLRELQNVPMMIDLVHMSRASFWDALRYYDGDLFVSHSNADALCPHPRNLTDDQIRAVAERNGVIGLNTFRGYVSKDPLRSTLSDLLDHAMYMCDLVGPEHLSIGADYCESPVDMLIPILDWVDPEGAHGIKGRARELYTHGPDGIEDASSLDRLAAGLAERGLNQAEVDLICGESYLRMLERARPSS
ncbi:membrane dipeptidase [Amycolatopsis sulphurea]|uniref:Membrane dipeptidase n=1 Tax=Amycolatopsis sulphurea TaxID=76022 RepID=A0A2A9G325_9PSEU|nr:membrane dipeptidase [Amycolatopsis sulphurea]PFG57553.1 membrane dipeptidase [Amycolatopsis sulphurea]